MMLHCTIFSINSLRVGQNGNHFADGIFGCILVNAYLMLFAFH